MRCYKHPDREALGTCKACHKGLCAECAHDLGHGLACGGEHEEMVEAYNTIIEKNTRLYAAAPKNTLIAPVFYAFMGVVFLIFGLLSPQGVISLPFIMGAGFLVFAIAVYIRSRRIFGPNQDKA